MEGISQMEAVMPETLVVLIKIIVMMEAAMMAVVTTAVEMGVE